MRNINTISQAASKGIEPRFLLLLSYVYIFDLLSSILLTYLLSEMLASGAGCYLSPPPLVML